MSIFTKPRADVYGAASAGAAAPRSVPTGPGVGGASYSGGGEVTDQGYEYESPLAAYKRTNAATTANQETKAAEQSDGYYEASSLGRSSDASKEYLSFLRQKQGQAGTAGAASAQGYQAAQLAGAQGLSGLASQYGERADLSQNYFNAGAQNATIARQKLASEYLYGVARGAQPSVAQLQMQQGQRDALASNLALAGSGRGGSSGVMLDQALRGNAASQQSMVAQSAQLRAQESIQAMQAAAGIDASRYGQQAQSAGLGLQYDSMQAQAQQQALAAQAAAYSGSSDIDLAYRGLDRSYEDLIFGGMDNESARYLSALTGQGAQAFSRQQAVWDRKNQQTDALIGAGAQAVGTGVQAYYGG